MPLVLDGKAAAARIKDKLSARVQALKDRGYTPGLGTLLVREDPGSVKYVADRDRIPAYRSAGNGITRRSDQRDQPFKCQQQLYGFHSAAPPS